MATLFIVKMLHTNAEAAYRFIEPDHYKHLFWQLGLQAMWRDHIKRLRQYGLFSHYGRPATRWFFVEGTYARGEARNIQKRWRDRRAPKTRKMASDHVRRIPESPAVQIALSAPHYGMRIGHAEDQHAFTGKRWKGQKKRRRKRYSRYRHRMGLMQRDQAIARNIASQMGPRDSGVLLIGAGHNVRRELRRQHIPITVVELNIRRPRIAPLPIKKNW